MEKIRIHGIRVLLAVMAAVFLLWEGPVSAAAAGTGYDGGRTVSIEIQMGQNDRHKADAVFYIYQIAVALPDAPTSGNISAELTEVYAPTAVSLTAENTSQLLKQIRTLRTYIKKHGIEPDYTVRTDEQGCGRAENLEQGVYLVVPDNSNPRYGVISTSMIVLPRQDSDGLWKYTEHIAPKYTDKDDEFFEDGEEGDTMLAPGETAAFEESQSGSFEESLPDEPESETAQGQLTSAAVPDTSAAAPSSTAPPTRATTSVVRTSGGEQQILGIEDPARMIGLALAGVGTVLVLLALGLLIRRQRSV